MITGPILLHPQVKRARKRSATVARPTAQMMMARTRVAGMSHGNGVRLRYAAAGESRAQASLRFHGDNGGRK